MQRASEADTSPKDVKALVALNARLVAVNVDTAPSKGASVSDDVDGMYLESLKQSADEIEVNPKSPLISGKSVSLPPPGKSVSSPGKPPPGKPPPPNPLP